MPDSSSRAPFAARVIDWQQRRGRHGLPWQATRDPYRVWLSEIMLQQTQVATVLDYYARFLARFPDVQALAAAPLEEVLALWSGLGYYTRARNLHRCAQAVVAVHAGTFPRTAQALGELPGIGPSTAAAIAAFCFGERAAILDGNVKRVLSRHLGWERDLAQASAERELRTRAEGLLPPAAGPERQHAAMSGYTQGLMDLGATVCTVRRPACGDCPVADDCLGRAAGDPERLPVRSRRTRRGRRASALLWLRDGDRVWLVQRPDSGVWAQLWTLPEFDGPAALEARIAGWPGDAAWQPAFLHVLTHLDWTLQALRFDWRGAISASQQAAIEAIPAVAGAAPAAGRWVSRAELPALGLPAPVRKLLVRP